MGAIYSPPSVPDPGKVSWDTVGSKRYQYGLDRGMLYPHNKAGVPWNGLVALTEGGGVETRPIYVDGIKVGEHITLGEFDGKLSAFTYPDEFGEILGQVSPENYFENQSGQIPGIFFHDQPTQSFGLSYRVKLGDELSEDAGYVIHLLYNLRAIQDDSTLGTRGKQTDLETFSWSLTATPLPLVGVRPTAHISIDSRTVAPEVLQELEDMLYGTETLTPSLPLFE